RFCPPQRNHPQQAVSSRKLGEPGCIAAGLRALLSGTQETGLRLFVDAQPSLLGPGSRFATLRLAGMAGFLGKKRWPEPRGHEARALSPARRGMRGGGESFSDTPPVRAEAKALRTKA